jgi:uncharacterized protein YjbI with pentapeptide repeats
MVNKEHASPQCQHYDICGRDVEGHPAEGLCVLHSTDAAKDARAFAQALASHRERNGERFIGFVFPERTNFTGATFSGNADFENATFRGAALFTRATFSKGANFGRATVSKGANFGRATVKERANFGWTTVKEDALFTEAMFSKGADFFRATFSKGANFGGATVSEDANFFRATVSGRTLFGGRPGNAQAGHIFAGTAVDFRQVVINPPDVITFIGADLATCRFLDTDLRKVQLVDVEWPKKRGRVLVYDEIASVDTEDGGRRPWSQIERLYRELKQNYEDRRDYERAGDFHYGEKEIRRQNPDTAWGLRFFLTLYWLFSGYGKRYLRPLLWAGLLFVGSTIGYMWWGLRPKAGEAKLAWASGWDWLQGTYYSFRVMTLLKPDDWVPVGCAHVIQTFQTLLGPLFLGLFVLALRQRLKR